MRLTDLSVRALSPPDARQKIYFDDAMPNFGIRLSYGGSRSWVAVVGKLRRLKTIGRYPETSLKQARSIARKMIASPPSPEPDAAPTISFDDALSHFFADIELKLSPRTVKDYRYAFSRHLNFKKTKLSKISSTDIRKVMQELKHKPSQQRLAFAAIRAMLKWAQQNELLTENPINAISAPAPAPSRDRVLCEEELAAVYRASITHPYPFGPLVRLLILTGQRRSEIAMLRWEWIDFGKRLITWPARAVKNRSTHVVPLEETAYSLLTALPHITEFVFPARGTQSGEAAPFSGWSKSKLALDRHLAGVDPYTLHDLRRTFASQLAMLGTPIHVTEKLLNHRSGSISGVAAIYNRYDYLDEQRQALRALEAHLAKLAEF